MSTSTHDAAGLVLDTGWTVPWTDSGMWARHEAEWLRMLDHEVGWLRHRYELSAALQEDCAATIAAARQAHAALFADGGSESSPSSSSAGSAASAGAAQRQAESRRDGVGASSTSSAAPAASAAMARLAPEFSNRWADMWGGPAAGAAGAAISASAAGPGGASGGSSRSGRSGGSGGSSSSSGSVNVESIVRRLPPGALPALPVLAALQPPDLTALLTAACTADAYSVVAAAGSSGAAQLASGAAATNGAGGAASISSSRGPSLRRSTSVGDVAAAVPDAEASVLALVTALAAEAKGEEVGDATEEGSRQMVEIKNEAPSSATRRRGGPAPPSSSSSSAPPLLALPDDDDEDNDDLALRSSSCRVSDEMTEDEAAFVAALDAALVLEAGRLAPIAARNAARLDALLHRVGVERGLESLYGQLGRWMPLLEETPEEGGNGAGSGGSDPRASPPPLSSPTRSCGGATSSLHSAVGFAPSSSSSTRTPAPQLQPSSSVSSLSSMALPPPPPPLLPSPPPLGAQYGFVEPPGMGGKAGSDDESGGSEGEGEGGGGSASVSGQGEGEREGVTAAQVIALADAARFDLAKARITPAQLLALRRARGRPAKSQALLYQVRRDIGLEALIASLRKGRRAAAAAARAAPPPSALAPFAGLGSLRRFTAGPYTCDGIEEAPGAAMAAAAAGPVLHAGGASAEAALEGSALPLFEVPVTPALWCTGRHLVPRCSAAPGSAAPAGAWEDDGGGATTPRLSRRTAAAAAAAVPRYEPSCVCGYCGRVLVVPAGSPGAASTGAKGGLALPSNPLRNPCDCRAALAPPPLADAVPASASAMKTEGGRRGRAAEAVSAVTAVVAASEEAAAAAADGGAPELPVAAALEGEACDADGLPLAHPRPAAGRQPPVLTNPICQQPAEASMTLAYWAIAGRRCDLSFSERLKAERNKWLCWRWSEEGSGSSGRAAAAAAAAPAERLTALGAAPLPGAAPLSDPAVCAAGAPLGWAITGLHTGFASTAASSSFPFPATLTGHIYPVAYSGVGVIPPTPTALQHYRAEYNNAAAAAAAGGSAAASSGKRRGVVATPGSTPARPAGAAASTPPLPPITSVFGVLPTELMTALIARAPVATRAAREPPSMAAAAARQRSHASGSASRRRDRQSEQAMADEGEEDGAGGDGVGEQGSGAATPAVPASPRRPATAERSAGATAGAAAMVDDSESSEAAGGDDATGSAQSNVVTLPRRKRGRPSKADLAARAAAATAIANGATVVEAAGAGDPAESGTSEGEGGEEAAPAAARNRNRKRGRNGGGRSRRRGRRADASAAAADGEGGGGGSDEEEGAGEEEEGQGRDEPDLGDLSGEEAEAARLGNAAHRPKLPPLPGATALLPVVDAWRIHWQLCAAPAGPAAGTLAGSGAAAQSTTLPLPSRHLAVTPVAEAVLTAVARAFKLTLPALPNAAGATGGADDEEGGAAVARAASSKNSRRRSGAAGAAGGASGGTSAAAVAVLLAPALAPLAVRGGPLEGLLPVGPRAPTSPDWRRVAVLALALLGSSAAFLPSVLAFPGPGLRQLPRSACPTPLSAAEAPPAAADATPAVVTAATLSPPPSASRAGAAASPGRRILRDGQLHTLDLDHDPAKDSFPAWAASVPVTAAAAAAVAGIRAPLSANDAAEDLVWFARRVPLGTLVDARDVDEAWCMGVVVGEARDGGVSRRYVRVHYAGWDSSADDWVNVADGRLAPLGLFTFGGGKEEGGQGEGEMKPDIKTETMVDDL